MKKEKKQPEKKTAPQNSPLRETRVFAGTKTLFGAVRASDAVFAAVFLFTAVFFFVSVRYGVQSADESFYLTIPYRLMQGDRLLIDDWHFSQFSALFQYLPMWAFIRLTGGTAGLILFFRRLYVVISLVILAYVYFSLREYGYWAVLAASVFTGYHSFGYTTLNYYAMSNAALLLVLMLLFVRQKRKPYALIFTGFLFACCVLIEPVTALLYFLFCGLLLVKRIRARRGKDFLPAFAFALDGRLWLYFTAGVFICAVGFFAAVLAGADVSALLGNLPLMVTDSEYNWSTGTAAFFKWHKVLIYFMYCGYVPAALNALFILSLVLFRKKLHTHRALFLAAASAITAVGFAAVIVNPHHDAGLAASVSRPVIWMLFGFVCYILTENKNRRLFVFLVSGALFTVFTDFLSEVSVGGGGIVCAVPAVILFAEAFAEVKAEAPSGGSARSGAQRFARAALAVSLAAVVFCEAYNYTLIRTWHIVEDVYVHTEEPLDTELPAGPLQGVRTTASIARKYGDAMEDLDGIRAGTDGPLYVAALCPWYYLYAEKPVGVYSAFYVPVDSTLRVTLYWQTHPEKLPACIYVPFFDCDEYAPDPEIEEKLAFLRTVCDFDLAQGKAGYILTVRNWHLPETQVTVHAQRGPEA